MSSVRDSQQIKVDGGFVVPRRVSMSIIVAIVTMMTGAIVTAVRADERIGKLEAAQAKAEITRKEEGTTLRSLHLMTCRMCDAQLGREACNATCGQ